MLSVPRIRRELRAGDPEAIVAHHDAVYAREYDLDGEFAAHVAKGMRAAVAGGWPRAGEAVWIAESDGHAEDGIAEGVGRWPRTLELLESEVPVLIENTAGGENAVARRFDALARLWDAVAAHDGPVEVGFCFDTCHAHAAGEQLSDAVERAVAITGRLDLLHANDSRDPPGTGADRHARLGEGEMDTEALRGMIRAGGELGAPILVETPGPRAGLRQDLEFVRAALAR